jgi:hypothetical protein
MMMEGRETKTEVLRGLKVRMGRGREGHEEGVELLCIGPMDWVLEFDTRALCVRSRNHSLCSAEKYNMKVQTRSESRQSDY